MTTPVRTRVVVVNTLGPKGDTGPAGPSGSIETGSFAITGSNTFSGSQNISGSIYFNNGTSIITNFVGGTNTIDLVAGPGGWAELTSYNTQSYIWVDNNGAYIGTDWGISAYQWVFGNSGSLTAPGRITALSFTGSLFGTSSWANNAISSSFATSASYWSGSIISAATASYILNAESSSFASTASFVNNAITSSYINTLNQSVVITGSTQGNVTALSIASNTASLNLNLGNFYTLQLVAGTNTYINPSNIKAGQSSMIRVSTTGSATVSFPSTVKQPSGSAYTPTTSTGTDILTLVSFDGTNLNLVSVKNLL